MPLAVVKKRFNGIGFVHFKPFITRITPKNTLVVMEKHIIGFVKL